MGRGESSLRQEGRKVAIFTTASLPWMTGTAVNPLLRAAYLAKQTDLQVTLVVPWLARAEQRKVFPGNLSFSKAQEQEQWVRQWVEKRTQHSANFKIIFYAGHYDPAFMSIFPVGDLPSYLPDSEADVAILEEPEHLTWFHHGTRWTDKFNHVVGIIHTNYLDYARRNAPAAAVIVVRQATRRLTNIHCHKVIKLSDAVQAFPRSTTEFVHGVPRPFLERGDAMAEPPQPGAGTATRQRFSAGAYFLGKGIWGKGYTELLDLLTEHKKSSEAALNFEIFGSGEDMPDIKAKAEAEGLDVTFHDGVDHLDERLKPFRVFVNPSTSDVVATTSAEALAMGKWVICAEHPSNAFFKRFDTCLIYKDAEEFSLHLQYAQSNDPTPLSLDQRWQLTWECATERFLNASSVNRWPGPLTSLRNSFDWRIINTGTGLAWVRHAIGAGRNTHKTPDDVDAFDPSTIDARRPKRHFTIDTRFEEAAALHESLGYPRPRAI
ncbi:hypothetical protein WJX73_002211 [Symbiochloris irregularis]|uniref:digalactosyldiacylglycerol synthase n=1 Tax=Symbiochloris irregularis TaxID=706552 RepID=A0AAW1NMZ3_9CHLO